MNIRKTIRKWSRLAWLIAFAVMSTILLSGMWTKESAAAGEVIIDIQAASDGGLLVTEGEIRRMLEQKESARKASGEADGPIPAAEMEQLVRQHPLVERADVFVDARHRVQVRIEQPDVLLRVVDRRGASYYLSTTGKKLPLSSHHTPRVPVVTGDIPMFEDSLVLQEGHMLHQLMELGQQLNGDSFTRALIEQIDYKNGEFVLVPKMGRFRILTGDARHLPSKMRYLKAFYQQVLPSAGWDTYQSVDLRFKGQIVCRKA